MTKLTDECINQIFDLGFTLQNLEILSDEEDWELFQNAQDLRE